VLLHEGDQRVGQSGSKLSVFGHRAHDIVGGVEALGNLGRRLVAWLVLAVVAVIVVKILVGILAGFVQTVVLIAALLVLGVAALWALRRI